MTKSENFGPDTDGATVANAFHSSVEGKTILVTGVSPNGIGLTTAEALAAHNPSLLILTGRTKERTQQAIDHLKAIYPEVPIRFLKLDLSTLDQVRKAAEEVMNYSDVEQIDILICNAGVMAIPDHETSPEGIEQQFVTNYLSHFLLTNLILPKLLRSGRNSSSGATRIINVSSKAHWISPVRFSDINFGKTQNELPEEERPNNKALQLYKMGLAEGTYHPWVAYSKSKTASILFTLALNRRLLAKYNVRSYSVHPGAIVTELFRHAGQQAVDSLKDSPAGQKFKTHAQGSSTTLAAALDPLLAPPDDQGNNLYLEDSNLSEAAAPFARDPTKAEELWHLSENLVGQKFSY